MKDTDPRLEDIPQLITELHNLRGSMDLASFRNYLVRQFGDALSISTMQGHVFLKPYGYSGDFEIIDRIYTKYHSPDPDLKKWDMFFHKQEGAKAVRNRKMYFIELVDSLEKTNESPIILNIGSGPGRDMFDFFQRNPTSNALFVCIDADSKAINYASSLCKSYSKNIEFIHKNIFRYRPTRNYDLIWSAGLFDYFDDNIFARLLKRLYAYAANNGEIVISNFSEFHPSRVYMEVIGDWFLNHRSKEQLISLAKQAGVNEDNICVNSEPLSVNLFLHLKKAAT